MKQSRKIKYTDEHIGKVRVIPDFLPSPENLVMGEDTMPKNDTKSFKPLRYALSGEL